MSLPEKQANMRDRWRRRVSPDELLTWAREIQRTAEPMVESFPDVAELLSRAAVRLQELAALKSWY